MISIYSFILRQKANWSKYFVCCNQLEKNYYLAFFPSLFLSFKEKIVLVLFIYKFEICDDRNNMGKYKKYSENADTSTSVIMNQN